MWMYPFQIHILDCASVWLWYMACHTLYTREYMRTLLLYENEKEKKMNEN